MKKKLLGLVFLGMISLASCGEDTTKTTKETTTVETTTKETTTVETTTKETTTVETTTKETTTNPITTTKIDNDLFEFNGNYLTLEQIKSNLYKNTEDKFYGFTLDDFNNKLNEPSLTVSLENKDTGISQIIDILDYCAFYHLDSITITFEGKVSGRTYSELVNYSYWGSKLLVSVVNFTLEEDENKVIVHFIYNDEANTYISNSIDQYIPVSIPYTFYSTVGKRDINNDVFGYQSYTNGIIDVYNSDQLVYVLENKYIPNPLPNSPAEKIFNKAKKILNSIIYDDMTLLDKETAIQTYILSNASYATSEDYATYVRDFANPDEIMSMLQGAYVEGVLDGKEGVCHGFAKALSLLSSIEGIDSVKVSAPQTGTNPYETISSFVGKSGIRSYQSHGYVYVTDPESGLIYVNDPTYAFFTTYSVSNKYYYFYREFAIMKSYPSWKEIYRDQAEDLYYLNNHSSMAKKDMNYKENFKIKVNDTLMDLYLTTNEEVDALISNLNEYISNYSDSNYGSGEVYTLNVFANYDVFVYTYEKFYESKYLMPFISYVDSYPDLGFAIIFN